MHCLRLLILLIATLILYTPSMADDVDVAQEKLSIAREASQKALEVVQSQIRESIENKIKKEEERKKPDLTKIETLNTELKSLENGDFPQWIDQKQKKAISDAHKGLREPLQALMTAYIRSKDLDKARMIEEELKQIEDAIKNPSGKKNVPQPVVPFSDAKLWNQNASDAEKNSAAVAEIRKRLQSLNYSGPIALYLANTSRGKQFFCFIRGGIVIRSDQSTSTWNYVNQTLQFRTQSSDRKETWTNEFFFEADLTEYRSKDATDKVGTAKLLYGDPASTFGIKK